MQDTKALIPNIAVILTCYNEGPYIKNAVQSVLDQTAAYAIGAIIIMDDGSDAMTLSALAHLEKADSRISVIYGPGGAGQALQRNRAVDLVVEPLIAFLDGDDYWDKDKLAQQLNIFEKRPETGLVYTGYYTFPDGAPEAAVANSVHDLTDRHDLLLAYFMNDPPILPSTVVMRREVYLKAGGMDASIRCFEETEFYARIAPSCRFACLALPLLYKRNRAGSITGGRNDLIAHHAFVTYKIASGQPRLMRYASKRLGLRARKLASMRFLTDNIAEARDFVSLAIRLNPTSPANWLLAALCNMPAPARRSIRARFFGHKVRSMISPL